jgi:hypothetical protein
VDPPNHPIRSMRSSRGVIERGVSIAISGWSIEAQNR